MSQNAKNSQDFARARDELFSHIHRCGVLKATREQQEEWMNDTIEYTSERYPELGEAGLTELREIGMRFCRPVIDNVQENDAEVAEGQAEDAEAAAA